MKEKDNTRNLPAYSKDGSVHVTDEIINTATHMVGGFFALFGTALLIVSAAGEGKVWHVVSFAVYGVSLISLFVASSLHHGVNLSKRLNDVFRLFDYIAIYLLIAGTYTPLCLVVQRNKWGWTLFGVVWALTAIGITIKSIYPELPRWVSNTFYIGIGWVGAILIVRSIPIIGWGGFALILAGGVVYTVGAMIFYFERPNPVPGKFGFHEIWHLFVLTGAVLHYLFMYFIVLPLN
jgi:hemolysin III